MSEPGAARVWLKILAFLFAVVAALFVAQQLGNALHRRSAQTPDPIGSRPAPTTRPMPTS